MSDHNKLGLEGALPSDSDVTAWRARWVAPEVGRLICDGVVLSRAGTVVACGKASDVDASCVERTIDLGDAIIFPGFINAHTHLELTDMAGRVAPCADFAEWLRAMMAVRAGWTEEDFRRSSINGIQQSLLSGVACVGNIATHPCADDVLPQAAGLRSRVFVEAIGPKAESATMIHAFAESRRETYDDAALADHARGALSPHAPYSVSARLFRMCFEEAARRHEPVCVHAAETREEEDFLARGEGGLFELMRESGFLPADWRAPGMRPIPWLAELGLGRGPALIAHGNYANADEIIWMAHNDVSVAFCPPSHVFFSHEPYPLTEMLRAGVNVCLGTDSLASADSLDILAAARLAKRTYRDVSNDEWVAMLTRNGARALGWSDRLGALTEGKACAMTVLTVPKDCDDPVEYVLSEPARAIVLDLDD